MSSTGSPRGSRPTQLLAATTRRLAAAGITSAAAEARALLASVVDGELILAPDLDADQRARLDDRIAARLAGTPLQHVLGVMPFCHLELISDARALIARPETELLAAAAITELQRLAASRSAADPLLAIDLGTGSGALALALATSIDHLQVIAVDIDDDALALAADNVARYRDVLAERGSSVSLHRADLRALHLADLAISAGAHVVVANPPYLPDGEIPPADVTRDPARALFGGGADGMDLPRATVRTAARLLRTGGLALVEHHDSQGPAMRAAATAAGLIEPATHRDLAGRDRFASARARFTPEPISGKIEP